jgi:glycosyltransferase involved in cell wall biosynthesis
MKICLVSNLYPPIIQGGAEIYVGRLARALAEDHQVVVLTTEPGFHLAPRHEVTQQGIVVYRLAPLNLAHLTRLPHQLVPQAVFRAIDLYHPQVARSFGEILRRERPDVVHLHNWVGISLAATLAAGGGRIPTAITLHGYSLVCAYDSILHPNGHVCRPELPCRALAAVNRWLTKRVGLVISPSGYALDVHQRSGFFRRAARLVLPNGIPSVVLPERSPGKTTLDVLFIGRVQRHKGPEVLIRAFRRLPDPTLRLHIAGAGPALETCRALAAGDARIQLYGFVQGELRQALLQNADCMVLPSLWPENYPVSIQEAFQYGPIVVASRVGGIPEMVRDGVNGLLVEPGDEAGIASAIERLRRSPELSSRLRASALETTRFYDMAYHIAHLTAAYQRLIVTERTRPFPQRAA